MTNSEKIKSLEDNILNLVEEYYKIRHANKNSFIPYVSKVPVNGRIFDEKELKSLVKASLDFWLTDGDYSELFSDKLGKFLDIKHVRIVNSGSSANLVALSSLTNRKIKNHLKDGDKVVTSAVGFPTTVNPIFQNNLIPIFVDNQLETYNPCFDDIVNACDENTKAIFMAHTLGNPFDVIRLKDFCDDKNIWLVEDNCDALGSKIDKDFTGTIGHISTLSFYPAHHITMGEGGAVLTNSNSIKLSIDSFRDWGRDCWCKSGHDNTCNKRFDWQLGDLPHGYDHKFTYSNIGYNLKATDLQASIGVAQIDKLESFILKRKQNWKRINNIFSKYNNYFILHKAEENTDPSWFGYAVTLKDDIKFSRNDFVKFLNENNIATRLMFGGNLIRQPAYKDRTFEIYKNLNNADIVMKNSFWLGVYPGLSSEMLDYLEDRIDEFIKKFN